VRDGEAIADLGPGDYFGELALLDAGPRTATVVATDAIDVLVIGRQQFNTVLDEVPGLARRLLTTTARRLREASTGLV
jgi:CRP/FNR family cyclic AMP-dependent transcriptional regulator